MSVSAKDQRCAMEAEQFDPGFSGSHIGGGPNNGAFARFDGISRTCNSDTISDRIFANGFDP
ncbi:MAG: hypothetical protein ABIR16_06890 [Dokdonella sp.]